MASRKEILVLRRADQLEAVASPIRCQVVDELSVFGPSSVRQIAVRMKRSPESLYYHIKILVDVGIVVQDRTRQTGRRVEAVYRLVAPKMRIDRKVRSKDYMDALARACSALLRLAERNYRAALEHGGFVVEGRQRDLAVRQYNLRLDRKGLAEVNALLDRLTKLKSRCDDATSGETYAVTLVLSKRTSR